MEKKVEGTFIICDFSQESKRLGLPLPKVLYHFYTGPSTNYKTYLIKKEICFDPEAAIKELEAEGVFVHDKTLGQEISPESKFVPKDARILGYLQLHKYLRGLEIIKRIE